VTKNFGKVRKIRIAEDERAKEGNTGGVSQGEVGDEYILPET